MDHCTVETGFLSKKPCGTVAVSHCANCEQPLCAKHAVPELLPSGKRSGKFHCKDCVAAIKDHDKAVAAAVDRTNKMAVLSPKPGAPGAKPPQPGAAKAEPPKAAGAPGAKPAGAAAAKPAAKPDDSGAIEFTPSTKPGDKGPAKPG